MATWKRRLQITSLFAAAVLVMTIVILIVAPPEDHAGERRHNSAASTGKELTLSREQFIAEIENMVEDGKLLKQGRIEVDSFETSGIGIRYLRTSARPIMTRAENEVITTGLVKFAIDVLMAHGHDPRTEGMYIRASAYQPTSKSVTGRDQVHTHGRSAYNAISDRIEFSPAGE